MAGFSISNAIAGAGSAIADVAGDYLKTSIAKNASIDLLKIRADIDAQRDARLNEYSTQAQTRGFEHTEKLQGRGFEHTEKLQGRGFEHAEGMQERGFTHAELMQTTALEHAAKENAENRKVQREGQAIQRAQVGIAAQGAALDREIKQIQIKNAKEVDRLRTEFQAETDPKKRGQIQETIQLLTGKDNDSYLPVPIKDEAGAITGYQIFDKKRGAFVEKSGPAAAPSPADIEGLRKRKDNPAAISFFDQKFGPGAAQKILGGESKPTEKPQTPARDGGLDRVQAQLDFETDAAKMTPQALVAKYTPYESDLNMQQLRQLTEARAKIPKRVPFVNGVFARER